MNCKDLKVGDKVRIVSVPGYKNGKKIKDYCIHRSTVIAYNKLIARKRAVRISEIDEHGHPWFEFKLKERGKWVHHFMAIFEDDNNWVKVKPRKK